MTHVLDAQAIDYQESYGSYLNNTGISNILDLKRPIDILKDRLSRANIIQAQKSELKQIYENCLASKDFSYTDPETNHEYKLSMDLLLIKEDDEFKIYVPKILIGPLLSYTHLLGHLGVKRMINNLKSYYFETKYTIIKKFVTCCYACFLNHGSSRKTKIGNYPIAEFPFEEVSVELAESLNMVNGYSHLLIVQCILTNFILVYPLTLIRAAYIMIQKGWLCRKHTN
jgi:Integrase zinc binding domain